MLLGIILFFCDILPQGVHMTVVHKSGMVYVPEGREGVEFLWSPLGIMSDTRPKPSLNLALSYYIITSRPLNLVLAVKVMIPLLYSFQSLKSHI